MKKSETLSIKTLRKRLGLSQAEFAERLGIERSHLSRLEAGKRVPSKPVSMLLTMMEQSA